MRPLPRAQRRKRVPDESGKVGIRPRAICKPRYAWLVGSDYDVGLYVVDMPAMICE
jgi:hypothetical protein